MKDENYTFDFKSKGGWGAARIVDRFCLKHSSTGFNWYDSVQKGNITLKGITSIAESISAGDVELSAKLIREYVPSFFLTDQKSKPKSKSEPKSKPKPKPKNNTGNKGDNGMGAIDAKMGELRSEIESLKKKQKSSSQLPSYKTVSPGYIKPEYFDIICKYVEHSHKLLLFGEPGTGKSRTAREIAKTLKLDFFSISFAGGMRYAQVFGGTKIKDGNTFWQAAPFLENIQKKGLTLMDEIFSCDPQIGNGMLSILEPSQGYFTCPLGTIKVNPEHRFIATANVSGREISNKHTGTFRSDDALLNRFLPYKIEPSTKVENAMLAHLSSKETARHIKSKLKNFRKALRENEIRFDATTRHLIRCVEIINSLNMEPDKAFEAVFFPTLSKAERNKTGQV